MAAMSSQYIQTLQFTDTIPDEISWERCLIEIGLDREAFHIAANDNGSATMKFWEPDRVEALRVIARLEMLQ